MHKAQARKTAQIGLQFTTNNAAEGARTFQQVDAHTGLLLVRKVQSRDVVLSTQVPIAATGQQHLRRIANLSEQQCARESHAIDSRSHAILWNEWEEL